MLHKKMRGSLAVDPTASRSDDRGLKPTPTNSDLCVHEIRNSRAKLVLKFSNFTTKENIGKKL